MSNKGFICAVFLSSLLFYAGNVFTQQGTVIKWERVYGAGGYLLEIRNNQKKTVVEKELQGTSYDVFAIPAGSYEYRVTTLNKLKKKGSSTGWIRLTIEKAVIPSITKLSRNFFSHSYDNPPLIITGANFLRDTKLFLKNEKDRIELGAVFVSGTEVKAQFRSDKKIIGVFDLVAVNRGGFEAVMPSAVEIIDPDIPVIESLSVNKIYGTVETELLIKGKNLGTDTVLIIENGSGNKIKVNHGKISGNEIKVTVTPEAGTGGIYNITAVKRKYFVSQEKPQLEVLEPDIPILESLSTDSVYQSIETSVIIRGKNLQGNVQLHAKNSSGDKIELILNTVSDTEIHIKILPGTDKKGDYSIYAVKHGLFKSENFLNLKVVAPEIIKITSFKPGLLYISKGKFTLAITGENIDEKTVFELRGPRAILKPYKVSGDSQSIQLYFEEKSFNGGEYSLFCENKPFKPVVVEKAFVIHDTSGGMLGLDVLTIGAGLEYNVPEGDWSEMLEPSMTGFHLYLSYPLTRILPVSYVSALKNCVMEIFISYASYQFKNGTAEDSFTRTAFYGGLNYPFSLGFIDYNLSLILNIDAGMAYTTMSYIYDEEPKEYSSMDTAIKGGMTLRYEWLNYYFTDLSAEYSRIFYVSHPLDEIKISLGAGIRL